MKLSEIRRELMQCQELRPGERLRLFRAFERISALAAAELFGKGREATVLHWESGAKRPRRKTAQVLEEVTGIPSSDW